MPRICPQCGVKYQSSATKCIMCNIEFPDNHVYSKKRKFLLLGILGIILVGIAVAFVMMLTGPKAAIRRVMDAHKRNDPEAIMDTFPDFLLESDKIDREAFELEVTTDALTLSQYIFSYNVEEVKNPTSQEREALMEDFRYFGGKNFDESDIQDIKIIWVNYKGDVSGFWPSHATRFIMIKYQGRWCWWPANVNR